MKILVVYYSRSGHTYRVASEIANRCRADVEAIRESRDRHGLWGYCRSTWDSLVRAEPPILAATKDPSRYDLVIIGSPVWDLGLAAPVRSYVRQHAAQFKQVAFFCTEGGSGDRRAFDELGRICGKVPVATMTVTERLLAAPAHVEPVCGFVARLASA
jgi:flavodoxin